MREAKKFDFEGLKNKINGFLEEILSDHFTEKGFIASSDELKE